jgi:Holliday junction resolvase RusA-like endonuclease
MKPPTLKNRPTVVHRAIKGTKPFFKKSKGGWLTVGGARTFVFPDSNFKAYERKVKAIFRGVEFEVLDRKTIHRVTWIKKRRCLERTQREEVQGLNCKALIFLAGRQRPDPSNIYNAIADILQALGVIKNDYSIRTWWGSWVYLPNHHPFPDGRIELTLTPRS